MDGSECQAELPKSQGARGKFTPEQIATLRRNPPLVMNEREMAVYVGISERHARVLRQRRAIAHVRLGGRILYRLAEVNKALERLEIRAV